MSRMKSSWDHKTQDRLLNDLIEGEFPDEEISKFEEQLEGVSRQPDLIRGRNSEAGPEYIYLLQPQQTNNSFLRELCALTDHNIHLFIPVPKKELVEEFFKDVELESKQSYYRLACGQLQVFNG